MALTPGTRIGSYEIAAQIGVGGMGEVYRATDTRLKRDVAVKVLPEALAADAERLARFQREAEVLASLNHPGIAHIYGIEDADGSKALVMELVEGPTLADRIAQGPMSQDEALAIARQIADALEAAHEQGIVHRDLKPANVKVRPDGTVKVLDFGLAKAVEPSGAMSSSQSMSPTITTPAMTQAGLILGTAAYMSPEQAKGRVIDRRTDIWSFGCVLYEMVTGERLFRGEDTSEVLAAVLKDQPDWSRVPYPFRRVMEKCLERDPKRRLRDVSSVALLLETQAPTAEPVASSTAPRSVLLTGVGAAAIALLLAGIAAWSLWPPPSPTRTARFSVPPPVRAGATWSFAMSPDGLHLAMADVAPERRLWLRPIASFDAQPLSGTEGAVFPFWSPDSQAIGFFAGGELRRVALAGGAVQPLARVGVPLGGSWSPDGTVVFSDNGRLYRVGDTGGDPVLLEQPPAGFNVFPQFLPDGRRFLFGGLTAEGGVFVATSADDAPPVRVLEAPGHVLFASSPSSPDQGHILMRRGTALMAHRFDASRLELSGDPQLVAERVGLNAVWDFFLPVTVSGNGILAYAAGDFGQRQLTWLDRSGAKREVVSEPYTYGDFRLSPDRTRVVMTVSPDGDPEIYTRDLSGGPPQRLTFDDGVDNLPIWAPDGERVLFPSNRSGTFDLFVKAASGEGPEEQFIEMGTPTGWATDWSRDGALVLYQRPGTDTGQDLWLAPQDDEQQPFPYLDSPADEEDGAFSPDARWIAYVSDENGQDDVFVESFPRSGAKFQVSDAGGTMPVWRQDGEELYFLNRDAQLVAVPVGATGATLQFGTAEVLFDLDIRQAGRREYEVAPDGQRFLIAAPADNERQDESLSVVLDWQAQLEP